MRFVCAILFVLAFCVFADAQEQSFKITGVVKQLDLKGGTISIRRKSFPEDEKFSFLKKDIDVTTPSGLKAKVDTIKIGQTVVLTVGMFGDVEAVTINAIAFNERLRTSTSAGTIRLLRTTTNRPFSASRRTLALHHRQTGLPAESSRGPEWRWHVARRQTVVGLNCTGRMASLPQALRVKVSVCPAHYVGELTDMISQEQLRSLVENKVHLANSGREGRQHSAITARCRVQSLRKDIDEASVRSSFPRKPGDASS